MYEDKIYRIVAKAILKESKNFDPCQGCGGEDCACCEVYAERRAEDRANEMYGDDRYARDRDEDDDDDCYDDYDEDCYDEDDDDSELLEMEDCEDEDDRANGWSMTPKRPKRH